MELHFPTEVDQGRAVIVVEGDLDNPEAGEALYEAFASLANNGKRTIVFDLRDVDLINSFCIGKILKCYGQMKDLDGTVMVKPLTGFVKDVFELLMLDTMFPIDDERKNSSA